MERIILHSDLNAFFASVEILLDPSLRGKAVAVCGSTEDRHGIVLAKSELAKKAGVKTGMANWQAKQACPELILVHPTYGVYSKYSRMVREIYARFTDQIEPFGMDECWLDVTGSTMLFGDGEQIAETIRNAVKQEIGLTVSIGVSFNKAFAKLGSDMKKPDAVTVITRDSFRQMVWPLPASDLLFVGSATSRRLERLGIHTIGDIASYPQKQFLDIFGKNGEALYRYANGNDNSPVMHMDWHTNAKSVGHGITCTSDLFNDDEAGRVLLYLTQDIAHRLRATGMLARLLTLTVKDNTLGYRQYRIRLDTPSRSWLEMSGAARRLLYYRYGWELPIRALTVTAGDLVPDDFPTQYSVFDDPVRRERHDRLENAVDAVRERYGKWAVCPASLTEEFKVPTSREQPNLLPGRTFT